MQAINFRTNFFGLALIGIFALVAAGCSLLGTSAIDKSTATVNKNSEKLALKGYDPTAYFIESAPAPGKPEFTTEWNGAKWQFTSAENRAAFVKEPEKYAPQYGGYCAWAVGHGYTADTDPEAWKVVDGKLYLNYNKDVAKKWNEDIPKYVAAGDQNWHDLAGKAEESRKDK